MTVESSLSELLAARNALGQHRGLGDNGVIVTSRRKPRQERSRETLDLLIEAAAQVFSREGIAATTNRIAERAGVSVGTLYQYFPDKHALLRAVAGRHLHTAEQRLTEVFDRLRREEPPFDDAMTEVLELVVQLHSDRPRLHALLHRVATAAGDVDELVGFEDRIVAEVAFHLERCDRGGGDPELTARTIVHAVDAQVHRVLPRHGYGPDATAQLRLIFDRLAPPPP
ncbi:TetR family transcriptional regulator [Mycolicibacterium chitae]|uniref:TetR family transcriptional regulator n=1 Tax=Mycolicibacterium chitae TaxID=1792 RepID=A0A3S4SBK6_MYCCI|nr:TetR/AcrR family transcriptional regulator [Mycolicibacterium chitae]BBZ00600.1 TetR family transcriptional regulator [Mycolicibacterium chitae]VEG49449.1 TetR family transcriptional regulator [Mycolicibacterium chitae]